MPRVCSICTREDRADIDRDLVERNGSFRSIASRYGTTTTTLRRHRTTDLPASLVKATQAAEVVQADDLLARLTSLNHATQQVLKTAQDGYSKIVGVWKGDPVSATVVDYDLALRSVQRLESLLELEARLLGELKDRQIVNVFLSPDWVRLRTVIVEALAPYPEAREAVGRAIRALEGVGP